jgi:hypothetical protein
MTREQEALIEAAKRRHAERISHEANARTVLIDELSEYFTVDTRTVWDDGSGHITLLMTADEALRLAHALRLSRKAL